MTAFLQSAALRTAEYWRWSSTVELDMPGDQQLATERRTSEDFGNILGI